MKNTVKLYVNVKTEINVYSYNMVNQTKTLIYTGKMGDLAHNQLQRKLHCMTKINEYTAVYANINGKEEFCHFITKY